MTQFEKQKLHKWVGLKVGKASGYKCIVNASHIGKMEWANVSRQYKYDLSDFIPLCKVCHVKFDSMNMSILELLMAEKIKQELINKELLTTNSTVLLKPFGLVQASKKQYLRSLSLLSVKN